MAGSVGQRRLVRPGDFHEACGKMLAVLGINHMAYDIRIGHPGPLRA